MPDGDKEMLDVDFDEILLADQNAETKYVEHFKQLKIPKRQSSLYYKYLENCTNLTLY